MDATPASSFLFVYGTLIPGLEPLEMSPIVRKMVTVGAGSVGGRLYDLGAYPGVILDESAGRVRGQVMRVADPESWAALDAYEACPLPGSTNGLFHRVMTVADCEDAEFPIPCWIYVYHRDPAGAKLIKDGCWLTHRSLHKMLRT